MRLLKNKEGMLEITTTAYQSKKGAIILNWGKDYIVLNKDKAEKIFYDLDSPNIDDFKKFYFPIK